MSIVPDDPHWNVREQVAELEARNKYLAKECFRLLDDKAEDLRKLESARFWASRLEQRCAHLEQMLEDAVGGLEESIKRVDLYAGMLIEIREARDGGPLD